MNNNQLLYQIIEDNNLWEKSQELKRYEFLKISGSIDTNLYFISSGSLRILVIDDHEEITIRFGYTGNFIVSLDSFISGEASNFCIQALKKTKVKIIRKKNLQNLINRSSKVKDIWISILENLILQQIEREKDILTTSPVHRYERVLKRSPQLFQEIPNKYIAQYLRMTPETLSRIKKP